VSDILELGKENVTAERREHLKRTLPAEKRRELIKDIKLAPAWMHPIFRELAEDGGSECPWKCQSSSSQSPAADIAQPEPAGFRSA
jgi:hypothetical protein